MELNQKKHLTFAITIVLIILAGALVYYFSTRNVDRTPGVLSEQEKQAILAELAKESANTTPIPEEQKQAILKELSKESSSNQSAPLTEEQKAQILSELSGGTQ